MSLDIRQDKLVADEELERLQVSSEERARLFEGVAPLDVDAWLRETGPASAEELAEMEEFLRDLRTEREASLAREAGLQ